MLKGGGGGGWAVIVNVTLFFIIYILLEWTMVGSQEPPCNLYEAKWVTAFRPGAPIGRFGNSGYVSPCIVMERQGASVTLYLMLHRSAVL